MALLDRVATLIRANLNDLIDRAEDPEKMLKQVILDMQNQFMQVKTQVAIAIADQHLLKKKLVENEEATAQWMRKAEFAIEKAQDDLARPALERLVSHRQISEGYRQQLDDQTIQVENLKSALLRLEQKLVEAQSRAELLAQRHRRARVASKAADARASAQSAARALTFERMKDKVLTDEAVALAKDEMANEDLHERLLALGKQDEIERLLEEIKARKTRVA